MTMLTNCSKCKHIQPIDLAQLRSYRGMMRCENCLSMFDALEHLREAVETQTPIDPPLGVIKEAELPELIEESNEEPLAWEQPVKKQDYKKWYIPGVAIVTLALLAQIAYFNADTLLTNPKSRSWLESLCHTLSCKLPVYKNLQDFLILQGQLISTDNKYNFKTAISNQAEFAQNYPKVKLTLLDFAGNAFAQRLFSPEEYLKPDAGSIIAAKATVEISLQIAATKNEIGGYNFDLTY